VQQVAVGGMYFDRVETNSVSAAHRFGEFRDQPLDFLAAQRAWDKLALAHRNCRRRHRLPAPLFGTQDLPRLPRCRSRRFSPGVGELDREFRPATGAAELDNPAQSRFIRV